LLCFKCFEANGGVRKKCVKCKINLPKHKGDSVEVALRIAKRS
jgi:hypothetical protein